MKNIIEYYILQYLFVLILIGMNKSISKCKKIGDFQIGKTIGSGTFGKVKEGIHMPTGQKVAIKILQKCKITDNNDLQRIKHELQILMKVDHPNIIRLLQVQQTQKHIYIITELIQGKQLFEYIIDCQRLSEDLCGIYFCQIIDAIEYLHNFGICHRDIKPENILVCFQDKDKDEQILGFRQLKIIDFGLSKQFGPDKMLATSCGSPCYAAPQMLSTKYRKYDATKTDIWAVGVTLYAMAMGRLPFEGDDTEKLYKTVAQKNFNFKLHVELKGEVCQDIESLICNILQFEPTKRLSISELRSKHKTWLKKYFKIIGEYNQIISEQNDDLIIQSMSKFFKMSQEKIRRIISTKQISSISTYYFLCWQRTLKCSIKSHFRNNVVQSQNNVEEEEYLQHNGAFHLNFVFASVEDIEQFLKSEALNNPDFQQESQNQKNATSKIGKMRGQNNAQIVNKTQILLRGVLIPIKKLTGTELMYVDFPSYFTMNTNNF